MSEEELDGMTDSQKLAFLIRMVENLTNEVMALGKREMIDHDGHDRRIRKLELHVLDTEPSPAPAAPTNGDAS